MVANGFDSDFDSVSATDWDSDADSDSGSESQAHRILSIQLSKLLYGIISMAGEINRKKALRKNSGCRSNLFNIYLFN